MEKMVIITNMIDSQVSVRDPYTGINRRWQRRGQSVPLPYTTVEQLLWQDGFRRMIDNGILYIQDLQTKKDLGLEPQEATEPVNIIALTPVQIKEMLTVKPLAVFKRELSHLPDTQIDSIIDYAISNEILDSAKCDVLKEITGRDILKAVSVKKEMEAVDKAEKTRMSEGRRV